MGLVNDHLEGCASRQAALALRTTFTPPLWLKGLFTIK